MSAVLHAPVARPTEPTELTQYLYENYGQRVFTFCYSRLRDREEAQDAAQTTFIYVLRSLQRGVEPEFELAWLLKIAFNVCRGTRRSSGRHSVVTQEIEDMDELAAPQAPGYEGSERLPPPPDGLAHLPASQRGGAGPPPPPGEPGAARPGPSLPPPPEPRAAWGPWSLTPAGETPLGKRAGTPTGPSWAPPGRGSPRRFTRLPGAAGDDSG